jgi:uncharacterized protein (TIGR03083 family)
MRVFDMIVDERRSMADLLDGLSDEQLARPSLCEGWTVHDVAAHLTTFLRFGQAKLYLGIGGRAAAFNDLDGDGVPLLRARVTSPPQAGPGRRLATIVRVVVSPPPTPGRRSRTAVGLPHDERAMS